MVDKVEVKKHIYKYRVIYTLFSLFVLMLILHLVYNYKMSGDDYKYYRHFPEQFSSVFEYLKFRYNNWTSRLSVELIMFLFIDKGFLFAILDSLIFVLLVYSIWLLFDKKSIVISTLGVLALPLYRFSVCGLYAGSVNYIWPITFFVLGLYFIKKIIENKKLYVYEYLILLFSFLFVCFVEVLTVLLLVVMIIALIVNYKKNKKFSFTMAISMMIAIAGIVVMLTSKGNASRILQETNFYPEFENFNIFHKICLGFVYIANASCLLPSLLYYLLYIFLIYMSFKNKKDWFTKIVSLAPFIILVGFYLTNSIIWLVNGNINIEFLNTTKVLSFDKPFVYVLTMIGVLMYVFPVISMFRIFDKSESICLILLYTLATGLIGSFGLIVSISYYSDYRPTFFSSLIIFFMIFYIINSRYAIKKEKI